MANRIISWSSDAAAATAKAYERTDAVPIATQRRAEGLASLQTSEKMFQLASRLLLSLRSGEQIITCTGVATEDPNAKFATQLALALTRLGKGPVLLVDADFSLPLIHAFAGLSCNPGLADLLANDVPGVLALQKTGVDGLQLLAAGENRAFSPRLLSSSVAAQTFQMFRQFPFTIINAGAILSSCGGLLVSAGSDVVLGVVAAGERTRDQVQHFKTEVDRLKSRFLGVVVAESE